MQENRALSPMDAFELGVFEGGIALVARKWLSPTAVPANKLKKPDFWSFVKM